MSEWDGERLAQGRELRRLRQSDVAERAGVSQGYLSRIERNIDTPGSELIEALADVLDVLPSYFRATPRGANLVSCRAKARTPAWVKARVKATLVEVGRLVDLLRIRLALPASAIPVRHPGESAASLARRCRASWGLGLDTPIGNLTNIVEGLAGVPVYQLMGEPDDIDGAILAGDPAVIGLNPSKGSPSRARWDLAHELGHIAMMHLVQSEASLDYEDEAHLFAAEFLMPSAPFSVDFRRTWHGAGMLGLVELKDQWGVSVAAMIRRARRLNLISAAAERRSFKRLSALGWRRGEPNEPAAEPPTLLASALSIAAEEGLGARDLSVALGWTPSLFAQLTGVTVPPEPVPGVIPIFGGTHGGV